MPRLPVSTLRSIVSGAAWTSQRSGRGDGSVIGGRLALTVDPGALTRLSRHRTSVLVSGTNGKTTTAALLTLALATSGPVAANASGANLPSGLVSALALDPAPTAVLEVDEQYLPAVLAATRPAAVVLLNLSRDQMDRAGELTSIARRWESAFRAVPTTVVVNVDQPLLAAVASSAAHTVRVRAGNSWSADSVVCPLCGRRTAADGAREDGPVCGCASRQPADWTLRGNVLHGPGGSSHVLDLALPGQGNRANAALAVATAAQVGVPPAASIAAISALAAVGGRYAVYPTPRYRIRALLAKNPAGWQETLALLAPAPTPVVLACNAQAADGRDPSWLWDVDFVALRGRPVTVSGERWRDLAVRLEYADIACRVVPDPDKLVQQLCSRPLDGVRRDLEVVANYTAFTALRQALTRVRGCGVHS